MRDNRIKELVLGDNGDWSGATTYNADNDGISVYSKGINGEILSVDMNFDRVGSIGLSLSGVGVEFYRNNASSGATWMHNVPREFSQSTTGSIAGAIHTPFYANGPVLLSTGSIASGTVPLQCIVKYR